MEQKDNKLRANGSTDYGWKYTKKQLAIDDLDEFEQLMNRRDIRRSNVNKLRKILEKGEHFETPLVANERGGKLRLIDGNHRFEAIEEFFKLYPSRTVTIGVCYYENLSEPQEREVYSKWNAGVKQSMGDFIKQYWDTIPIAKKLKKSSGFPINVTPDRRANTVCMKEIGGIYLGSLRADENMYNGPWASNAMGFVERVQQLGDKDCRIMKQMMMEYVSVFGEPAKESPHYKAVPLAATLDIWLRNKHKFTPEQMKKQLRKLVYSERVVYWSAQQGREAIKQCRKDLLAHLGKWRGSKGNIFD